MANPMVVLQWWREGLVLGFAERFELATISHDQKVARHYRLRTPAAEVANGDRSSRAIRRFE